MSELKSNEDELRNKQIVLIILDKYSASYYSQIKNYLNTKLGIAFQCMRVETKTRMYLIILMWLIKWLLKSKESYTTLK